MSTSNAGSLIDRPGFAGVALLVCGVSYFMLASLITPAGSSAQPAPTKAGTAAHGPVLGSLVGSDHRVVVHASPSGPLYSVYSSAGELLLEHASPEEVQARIPHLGLDTLHAPVTGVDPFLRRGFGPGGIGAYSPTPIMWADPADPYQH